MKYFQIQNMKPNVSQFVAAVQGKISDESRKSLAYKATNGLFEQAQAIYTNLNLTTCDANLTQQQEHDIIALTTLYIRDLRTRTIHDLVTTDPVISDVERGILQMAIELYKATCEANHSVLGHPKWTND